MDSFSLCFSWNRYRFPVDLRRSAYCKTAVRDQICDRGAGRNYLDEAYEERDSWLNFIKSAIWFDPLRSDPRFKELLKKMNLDE